MMNMCQNILKIPRKWKQVNVNSVLHISISPITLDLITIGFIGLYDLAKKTVTFIVRLKQENLKNKC